MWDKAGQALHRLVVTVRGLIGLGLLLILMLVGGCADDTKPCTPVALYGPPPCDDDQDCIKQFGAGYYCDKNNSYDNGCGGKSTWATCKPGTIPDGGVKDGAGKDGCRPVMLYGPQPCTDDKDCASWYGAGYTCDKNNTFSNGCGGTSTWALCKPTAVDGGVKKDIAKTDGCQPVMLYGPKPCASDQECITAHGAGWYCDKNNTFGNGCGGTSTWPICRQQTVPDGAVTKDGCQPVMLYGPPPCSSDADCVKWYGAGYTCNKNNTYNNGCGGTSTWPICVK